MIALEALLALQCRITIEQGATTRLAISRPGEAVYTTPEGVRVATAYFSGATLAEAVQKALDAIGAIEATV